MIDSIADFRLFFVKCEIATIVAGSLF